MELLLALIYVSICVAIFKIFKIPVNQWSLSTAVLGGIVGIFLLLLVMNYNHPFTNNARIYFPVTPILPNVKGRVVEVPVHTNTPLKEGDVLFRIDPKPYEYVVAEKKAALAEAEQNVKQLKASLDQVTAQAERADAQLQLAQQNYDRQAQLFKAAVVAQATLDTASRNLDLRNRLSQRPKPKRSARGSPTRQILEALILPSQSCVPNSPTLSSTSIRQQYAQQAPGS
jgi:multidrug resistance efflux pump